ncbi:MAG: tetratricopeptide repeat protein [Bacteroidia bacterium]
MSNQEEKNDNVLDTNLNNDATKESNQSTPFESEEQLDLEIGQEEKKEDTESEPSSGLNVKTIVIAALLLLPIIFILYKTMGNKPVEEPVAQQNVQVDIAAYENAANTNPTYENLLILSNVYIKNGLAGKAIAPLEKAIALKPELADAYNNLGFAYTIIQQYKKGIEYCQKAIDIDTGYLLAKNNLNWAKGEQQKVLDAIAELEKTTEDKRNADYYIFLGLSYLKLQDYEKSIQIWNKALEKDAKNIAALNNIGVAYMSMLEYDKAIETFTKATLIDPNDQLSKNNLNWGVEEKKAKEELKKQEEEAKKATGVAAAPEKEKKKSKK